MFHVGSRVKLALRGAAIFSLNIYRLLTSRNLIFWGHLGLGDQICAARALEILTARKKRVILPVKSSNIANVLKIYAYLPRLEIVPIPSGPAEKDEKVQLKALSRKMGIPLLNGGREAFELINSLFPSRGLNRNLLLSSGIVVSSLESKRFRDNLLGLPQKSSPKFDYAFVHDKTERPFGSHSKILKELPVVRPEQDEPLWSLAQVIENATQVRTIGSSFMGLVFVANLGPVPRLGWNSYQLYGDDPEQKWLVEFSR